jgi:PleD family two-component response regulator
MIESSLVMLVDADVAGLRRTEQVLEGAGFIVMSVPSFEQARSLLASMTPEVVIADIKLAAFNGLHLAALCAIWRPGTPFIATHDRYDRFLEDEAKRLGAIYVVKTPERDQVVRTASMMLQVRQRGFGTVRRSHRKLAPVPTLVTVAASSAEIVDVSYSGVQLKLPTAVTEASTKQLPDSFDIEIPQLDLRLRASRIWASLNRAEGGWICGADISGTDPPQLLRWRDFVDSVAC